MQCHKVAHHPLCCQIYFMDNFIFTVVNARNWLGRNEGGTEATFTPTRPVQDGELEEISILIWPGSFLDDDRDSEYSSQPVPLRSSMQPHLPPKSMVPMCAIFQYTARSYDRHNCRRGLESCNLAQGNSAKRSCRATTLYCTGCYPKLNARSQPGRSITR